jgi:SAM-dependent methyltransferase
MSDTLHCTTITRRSSRFEEDYLMACRICKAQTRRILDLGESPPANALSDVPTVGQASFPLVLEGCVVCGNLQLHDCVDAQLLYRNYLYTTPNSQTLRTHYEKLYAYLAERAYLQSGSFVLEVGSNSGLFLQYLKPRVARVLGIDPAANICEVARTAGIDTLCEFFASAAAETVRARYGIPDAIIGRHCFAHNCDPHVMIAAAAQLLSDAGALIIENAYALNTIENNEFDQIYHEHMFYYSIRSVTALLAPHGLFLADVFLSPVHGGSIVFVAKKQFPGSRANDSVDQHLQAERLGLSDAALERFGDAAIRIRGQLAALVAELVAAGKTVYTYGASAKGNTLLNYVGLTHKHIRYCVDSTPVKQGKYLPKSNIQVVSEEYARAAPPDYFLLTAWNYEEEIIAKVRSSGNRRSKFIVPIPELRIVDP